MRTGSKQKLKYVIILEILRQETDADHPMQTNTLLKKLEEQGIECSRETLYSDIKALNENGFEIFCNRSSSNEYYIEDRGFDVPEIRILIDAVNAASFITPKKTVELVGKVAALGGSHRGEIMKSETKIYNTTKHSNEYIYFIPGLKKRGSILYFLDALGIEYLSFISQKAADLHLMMDVKICRSEIPSITSMNKEFVDEFRQAEADVVG